MTDTAQACAWEFVLSVLVVVIFGAIVFSVIRLANQEPVAHDYRPTRQEACAKRVYILCEEDMTEDERKAWTTK